MTVYQIYDNSYHGQQMSNGYYCYLRIDCNGLMVVSVQQLAYMLATWPDLIYDPIEWCEPCRDEETDDIIPCPEEDPEPEAPEEIIEEE